MEPLFYLRNTDYWNKFVKHEQPRAGPSPSAAAPATRKLRSSDVVFEIPPNVYWNALRSEEDETGIKEWSAPVRKQDPTSVQQPQNGTIQNAMHSGDWSDGSSAVWERFLALEEEAPVDVDALVDEMGDGNMDEKYGDKETAPRYCVEKDDDIPDDLSLSDLTDTILNFLCADQKQKEPSVITANSETSS